MEPVTQWRAAVVADDRLECRPTHQLRTLLRDLAAHDLGIGLPMSRRQAGPRTERFGRSEPTDVTDLGDEDRAEGATDPVEGLDGLVTTVVAQQFVDATFEHPDLPVVTVDQIPQRLDAHPIRVGELHRVEQLLTFRAEHVTRLGQHTFFGHHRVHLRLEATAELHQPRSITNQLPRFSKWGWSDPRLVEATETQ